MAETSGVHLDRVVAGEPQAMTGRQQARAAWPIPFFIAANSVPALFIFPNRHSNHLPPPSPPRLCLERWDLILTAWFGEFNEEEKALEARWRGNEGGFM